MRRLSHDGAPCGLAYLRGETPRYPLFPPAAQKKQPATLFPPSSAAGVLLQKKSAPAGAVERYPGYASVS